MDDKQCTISAQDEYIDTHPPTEPERVITVELLQDIDFMGHIRKAGERLVIDGYQGTQVWITIGHGSGIWLQLGLDAKPVSVTRAVRKMTYEELERSLAAEVETGTETAGLLADVCDAAFRDPERAGAHGYDGILERVKSLAKFAEGPK